MYFSSCIILWLLFSSGSVNTLFLLLCAYCCFALVLYLLPVPVISSSCYLFLIPVCATCSCYLSVLPVLPATCFCYLFPVPVTCSSRLPVPVTCSCCLFLHVISTSSCCIPVTLFPPRTPFTVSQYNLPHLSRPPYFCHGFITRTGRFKHVD